MDFSEFWGHNLILQRKSGLCTLNFKKFNLYGFRRCRILSCMESEEKDNQRGFYRCNIQLPFSFSIIEGKEVIGPYVGRTLNLGGGGMYFTTTCPLLQPGTLLLAEFLPSEKGEKLTEGVLPGDFMARVIREEIGDRESILERRYILAVEFKFPHKATKNDIVAYLNRYEAHQKK